MDGAQLQEAVTQKVVQKVSLGCRGGKAGLHWEACLGQLQQEMHKRSLLLQSPQVADGGVFYSCLGRREGAYNPCPKWARIYRLMTESGSKAFPASRAPEV